MTPQALRSLLDLSQKLVTARADLSGCRLNTTLPEHEEAELDHVHTLLTAAGATLEELLERYRVPQAR